MHDYIIVDGHCDTLKEAYDDKLSIFSEKYMFNINKALNKLPYIQFLASFINDKYDKFDSGYIRVNKILDKFYEEYNNTDKIIHIKSKKDINKVYNERKVGILLTTENGLALGGNVDNVANLYDRGIRVMSLTWNNDNFLASGAFTQNDFGLTKKGIECVKKMSEKNILIDVSHASIKSFYDIFSYTNKGVIATHSCVNSLCESKRNLSDEQIKIIAKNNGIIGICFYKRFLSNSDFVSVNDILNHIEYISNLVGTKFVGIGSDFDGLETCDLPDGIVGVQDIEKIIYGLEQRGFNKEEISNIMGENYIRVLKENLN